MIDHSHPDLSRHPPRSPYVRLGGFAHLPRLLDKARAFSAGKQGAYEYAAMMDRHFFRFTGINPEEFLKETGNGRSDAEMLAWVMKNMRPSRQLPEIVQWSQWFESIGPITAKGHAWIAEKLKENGPLRDDIGTHFDHLDLDDYVSFGGKG